MKSEMICSACSSLKEACTMLKVLSESEKELENNETQDLFMIVLKLIEPVQPVLDEFLFSTDRFQNAPKRS